MQNSKDNDVCSSASITTSLALACFQCCENAHEKKDMLFHLETAMPLLQTKMICRKCFLQFHDRVLSKSKGEGCGDGEWQAIWGSGGLLLVQSHRLLLTSNREPISGFPRWLGSPAMRLLTSDAKETVLNTVLTQIPQKVQKFPSSSLPPLYVNASLIELPVSNCLPKIFHLYIISSD